MDERLAISSTNISSERDTRAIRLWLYAVAALVLAVVLADYDAGCPVRPTSTKRPTRKFADVPADVEKDGAACRLEPIGSGCDGNGDKHPVGLVEGATENTTVVQALIDNLIERGLDPKVCRLFIIDGAKALSKVIRRTFGAHTPIQRCQIHKARNVIERLPKPLRASVRRALRQAWELDDAKKAERLLRNLARRLDQEGPGVAASILEGLGEMLTVNRLRAKAEWLSYSTIPLPPTQYGSCAFHVTLRRSRLATIRDWFMPAQGARLRPC